MRHSAILLHVAHTGSVQIRRRVPSHVGYISASYTLNKRSVKYDDLSDFVIGAGLALTLFQTNGLCVKNRKTSLRSGLPVDCSQQLGGFHY